MQESCEICGKPYWEVKIGTQTLCSHCWHELYPACYSCGASFHFDTPVVYLMDSVRMLHGYCEKCAQNPCCSTCKLPTRVGRKKEYDGEIFCSECYTQMINLSPDILKRYWSNVGFFLKKKYNFSSRSPLPLVVSHREIAAITGTSKTNELGLYYFSYREKSSILNFFKASAPSFYGCQIYLLRGMGKEESEEVLAHEAGHDLLEFLIPQYDNQLYSEGFAQYVASEYNVYKGRSERNTIIFGNQDPIYGEGARKIREMVQKYGGLSNVVNILRTRS